MRRLLLLLCGALVAAIAAEFSLGHREAGEIGPAAAIRPAGAAAPGVSRAADTDLARWLAVILDRPLFAGDRRPVAGASAAAAAGVPRLAGIIMAPDHAAAIFQQAKGAKPLVAGPGDSVGEWVVSTIAADGVSLRKADARITLTPQFDDGHTAVASAAAQHPASRWVAAAPTGLLRARWSNPQLQP
ncbi:MAG TPA: hypothetical protein VK741_02145 [Acetobacteraceae bacterium]|jgi:hypothetical protein|nr:hypothetical protein [Acetobacteraceae bacterium]